MSKLVELLKRTAEKNEFYKKRIAEYQVQDVTDITQYPVLTRQELQENRYHMFSEGYKSKYFLEQLRRQSSSGSSGIPVNVYWDYKDWYSSNLALWRKRLQWYGIRPSDKYVSFTLNAFRAKADSDTIYYTKEPDNVLTVNVSLIHQEEGFAKLIDIIEEFEPKWFYIQPFVLKKLIQSYQKEGKLPPKTLKYIETVGELLSSDLKVKAVNFFGVSLANMYGSEEMNGIAYECPYHRMHVLDDNVLVEVRRDGSIHADGEGETVITNLNNNAMPLVRYLQGDKIILDREVYSCPCGYSSSMIRLIKGRSLESILLEDGTELNSFLLLEVMAEVNNQFNDIVSEYRYVYDEQLQILLCCVFIEEKNRLWYSNVRKAIESIFRSKVLDARTLSFEVQLLDKKTQSCEGKQRIIEIRGRDKG